MGTNYYLIENDCPLCKRHDEKHIGKSSAGWNFALHVYPDENINNLEDWIQKFKLGDIVNEYGEGLSINEMVSIITKRKHPNGLLRSGIDGIHCVGNGEGTYDYFIGNFS
jgi:hypothetical protein